MRILIAGAAGFIGQRIVESLRRSHDVLELLRERDGGLYAQGQIGIDLADPTAGWPQLPKQIDVVIHVAQSRRYKELPSGSFDVLKVNGYSVLHLSEYALQAGAKKFVLASSGAVYRRAPHSLTLESQLKSPLDVDPYAASKLMGELALSGLEGRVDTHTLRVFFAYGPGQVRGALIPNLMHLIKEGQSIKCSGTEGLVINPVYIDDVDALIGRLVEREGPAHINVCGPDKVSLRMVAQMIGDIIGREPVFEFQPVELPLVADATDLTSYLGRGLTPFQEGLAETVRAFLRDSP